MKSGSNAFSIVEQKFMIPWSIKSHGCLATKKAHILSHTEPKWTDLDTAELDLLACEIGMGELS